MNEIVLLAVTVVLMIILAADLMRSIRRSELPVAIMIVVLSGLPAFYFSILVVLLVDWNLIRNLLIDASIIILSEATGLFLAKPIMRKIRNEGR